MDGALEGRKLITMAGFGSCGGMLSGLSYDSTGVRTADRDIVCRGFVIELPRGWRTRRHKYFSKATFGVRYEKRNLQLAHQAGGAKEVAHEFVTNTIMTMDEAKAMLALRCMITSGVHVFFAI